jgi:predicted membrane-bound spermidine synthase
MELPRSHVGISPGLFPSIAFLGLIILNLALVFRSLKKRTEKKEVFTSLGLNLRYLGKIALFVAFAWLYIMLLRPLGFVYASSIFFWIIFILAGVEHWGKALLFSFLSSVLVYLIFYRIFMVVLPRPNWPIPHPF